MRSYRRFVIIVLLSNSLPYAGCMKDLNSLIIQAEPACSTDVIEHTMPFEVYDDCPLVNCNLNGNKAVPFLVDTGASTNILDCKYAETIGVLPTSEEYRSLQGHPIRDASIDELNIGTLRLKNVHARVMNLGSVLGDDCPAKGILGYPVFRRFELCIDYPKRTVSFRKGAYRILEQSFEPVLTFVMVPVWIENQGPFSFILDTGCNMSLVEAHVLAELNPPKEETVPVVRMKMHGPGEAFCWIRKGSRHGIGNVRSEGISDAREYIRRAYGTRIDGVLGWRHMKDYKITINYPTCTYQFEKTGYPPEFKPVVVNVTPDLSKDVHLSVKEIMFEFSVPMREVSCFLSTFHCEDRWQDDTHFKLINPEGFEVDKEYEIILGHGFRSKKDVPLDWSPYRFKVVQSVNIQ